MHMADEPRATATKIGIVEDSDATGAVAEAYDYWRARSGQRHVPGILKSLSARPDFLKQAVDFSRTIQFSDGYLSRRHKEMIGAYASYLNHCPSCMNSYALSLKTQGASEQTVTALTQGDLEGASLTEAERGLMKYVEEVSAAAYRTTPEDVEKLRNFGWKEEQIAEAVYIISLVAMFNRIANAFGIPPPMTSV